MSDSAIIKDCLVHYDSQHIQVRKDFFDLCAYDKSKFNQTLNGKGNRVKDEPNQECMAKIIRLLETLTDSRREAWFTKALEAKQKGLQIPEPPKNIFIELTYKSICALLYDTYGESTVRNSVAELIARNFIRRRQKTNNSIPEYALNIEVIQQALKQREQDNLEGVLKSTAYKNSKGGVEINSLGVRNQQPRVLKSTAGGSEINTNNIYSNKADNTEGKKENAHVSDDNAPTPSQPNSSSSLQEKTGEKQPSKQTASHSQKKSLPAQPTPTKPELTTEFANDDEHTMWDRLSARERPFYVDMNTQERATYTQWCSLFTSRPPLGQAMFNACRNLAPASPTAEMMKNVRKFCFAVDKKSEKYPKGYYKSYGVKLWDVAEKWSDWEGLQEQAEAQQQTTTNNQKSALAQESGITRPELYRPAEDNNPLREAALTRQWIDPKKRKRILGNEAS